MTTRTEFLYALRRACPSLPALTLPQGAELYRFVVEHKGHLPDPHSRGPEYWPAAEPKPEFVPPLEG